MSRGDALFGFADDHMLDFAPQHTEVSFFLIPYDHTRAAPVGLIDDHAPGFIGRIILAHNQVCTLNLFDKQ